MTKLLKKIKLKGNESFNIREGWLRKGMRNVSQYPNLFTREDVMEILGVGSKMVKAIRFWLKAANLCYESNTGGNRSREIKFTDDFGTIIYNYDPYFEDPFTLSLIHYQIVANTQVRYGVFFLMNMMLIFFAVMTCMNHVKLYCKKSWSRA